MKLETFKTLQYNIARIFDINSGNRMFCSIHDFISKALKVRILDIPKPLRNMKGYMISQNF